MPERFEGRAKVRQLDTVWGWKEFQEDTKHIVAESFLFQASKFSHKVYAQLDAFKSGHRYVVWFDADVVFKAELTEKFLKQLVKGYFCAYLGRNDCYSETGFLIFDTKHPDFPKFVKRYEEFYNKRLLFLLDYWIDCRAFDTARHGLQARNLTPDVTGMVDVFDQSPLKDICDHDKGALKYGRDDGSL